MRNPLANLLKARTGPLTAQLVQAPGAFGLGRVPARLAPAAVARSICGYCSTGCSLKIHLDAEGQALNLSPDPEYPVNLGMACPKGWEALTPLSAPDRATTPLLRNPATGELEPVCWDLAIETMVSKFKAIQHDAGPAALSFLSTGQIVMEEMALLGALAKFGMGMVHVDSNTRQCMATAHTAYKESFGFDAPPFTYADFEQSDALVFIGANPCIAHPILWQRVMANARNPEIVVVDPRRTETAMAATLHVPLRPKSDLVLLYGLARAVIEAGAVDSNFVARHTRGYSEFASFVQAFPVERVLAETGLNDDIFRRLVGIVASGKRVSFWWTMGVNQGHESTRTAQAIINLALMTGNIGRPGTGANSITGQCNAMGSRLFGNATSLLGGYDFGDPADRAHVASVLGFDPALIPDRRSLAYDQILEAVERREIRGLWIVATNTAHSWVDLNRFRRLREKLDFLVVQDLYVTTETARMADLVLPAAGWGEKEGVLINSERRLGVIRKVRRAPGQALSDFAIFRLIAEAWGCGDLFRDWSSPEAAFGLLRELSRGQPCEFTGIAGYDQIEARGGIQWPWTETDEADFQVGSDAGAGERRLFGDGHFYTADERAHFCFDEPRPMPEPPDDTYPFLLLTGRGSSAQWHTGTRTDKSEVLRRLAPRSLHAEIHPDDATRLGIRTGDPVRVTSRRGDATAFALVTPTVQPGQLFLPMHFPEVNQLTLRSFDPHSRQPSYKACAVRIETMDAER
ncbi:nitrate reductase [mine drainage metagenome]|uniref:Nitrate reductase n=1 Tax=mine drainage metagenome TaxID=410659 RepID=A0A1J5S178_9ZZZZ